MKLNTKRTLLVGFSFMAICAFWQLYDTIVPLILKYDFSVKDLPTGIIMSLDNIFALFMLPLFGALSDKTTTRLGKRIPFVTFGTVGAVVFMMLLPISVGISMTYKAKLVLFIVSLLMTLLFMATYRSPAVSLMPDVTPKPLRSKGNAIINLMGSVGGLITLVLVMVLDTSKYSTLCPSGHTVDGLGSGVYSTTCTECNTEFVVGDLSRVNPDYTLLFALIALVMIIALVVLLLTVKENKFVKEREEIEKEYGIDLPDSEKENDSKKDKLPRPVLKSLIFILLSVAFWYMGYNAVTSAISRYAVEVWKLSDSGTATCQMVAMGAALITFVPIGIVSSKIGRKKTILIGAALLAAMFFAGFFFKQYVWSINIIFVFVGIAWAAINVNSFPMVVEMSKGSSIGKYTGYYYAFSMAAQVITPILSGYLLQISYRTLFPYAAAFVALSFVTMLFVKHGDSKPIAPAKGIEAFADMED